MGCVYKIENKITGKIYIGSTNNFSRRKQEHFRDLRLGEHYSKEMQADYNKYGENCLEMSIIEKCDDEIRLDREQYYINLYNASVDGYNFSDSAYASKAGFCVMDKNGENNPFYGKRHSDSTREHLKEKWKETKVERSGWKHKSETIKKMQEKSAKSKNANATHVFQYNLDGNFLKEWDCIQDAADFYNMKSKSSISNCCKANVEKDSNFSIAKGFIWKYAGKPKHQKRIS